MNRIQKNGLTYYQFDTLPASLGLLHGVFTRLGGVSEGHLASLNVGATVGDDPARVEENLQRVAGVLDVPRRAFRTVWQVHGREVLAASHADIPLSPPPQADAIMTDEPGLPLTMRFADCVPIVLFDPIRHVLALAHAGWKGTALRVASAAIEAMSARYGSLPGDIIAGIGPSIGPADYEVGADVAASIREAFPGHPDLMRSSGRDGHVFLDLWAANRIALAESGVLNSETAAISTASRTDEFFSHRAEKGRTGRFGVVAMIL